MKLKPTNQKITFVRAGEQRKLSKKTSAGILAYAKDWRMLVDLDKQLRFPSHIVATRLRPDIVLSSDSTRQVVLLELTVPWEDRLEEAFERKLSKYTELAEHCQQAGWRVRCLPVEVGCRGFAARSLLRASSSLGIQGVFKMKSVHSATEAAEKASRWLWLKKREAWK